MPVNWNTQQFQPNTRLDLSPLNQFAVARRDKRQQSLADLTLNTAEKQAKKEAELGEIWKQGQGNPQVVIPQLMQRGYHKEARELGMDVQKSQQAKQKALYEQQKNQMEKHNFIDKKMTDFSGVYSNLPELGENNTQRIDAYNNLQSKNPDWKLPDWNEQIDATLKARFNAKQEKQNIEKFGVKPIFGKKGDDVVAFQTSTSGGIKEIKLPEGVSLTPGLEYKNIGDKLVGLDKSGKQVISINKTIDPGKQADISLKQDDLIIKKAKEQRDTELFQAKKVDIAKKARAYKQQNKGQLASIQSFLDKAYSVKNNKSLEYTTGNAIKRLGKKIPGSEAANLQADIDYLVSSGVIETMAKLKAESPTGSTGFGALSEREMTVMQNAFSMLGRDDISPNKKREEVDRVIKIMETRAREQRAFSNENENLLGPEPTQDEKMLNDFSNF